MKPTLGVFCDTGAKATIDLPRLIELRMLLQASSGYGKSWALRRLLEVTAGQVQQIVIDPEGEFASLREKHDFVICAPNGGDALAHPKTAALLSRRLLETEASAVLDIYELKPRERHEFVRLFADALVNAPKALWHPVLVVLDEAHMFCPEKGMGESVATESIINLSSLGRKRGFSLVAATQRISKFNKSAAAELKTKLIGSCGEANDVKRAAFELGMSPTEAMQLLRALQPGHFYGFGPALHQLAPRELVTGEVETSHPKVGSKRSLAPPKPTPAIIALLPQLADLPKEAETELRTVEDLRRELTKARRELALSQKGQPTGSKTDSATAADLKAANATIQRLQSAIEALMKFVIQINAIGFEKESGVDPGQLAKAINSAVEQATKLMDQKLETRTKAIKALQRDGERLLGQVDKLLRDRKVDINLQVKHQAPFEVTGATVSMPRSNGHRKPIEPSGDDITAPQQKLLNKLAWLEAHGVYPAPKETLAAMADVSPTSGGYFNNLGALRNKLGLIDYPTPGTVHFTDAGRERAQQDDDPRPVHEHWLEVVTDPQRKILEALISRHPEPIGKDDLANEIGVSPTSGGYFNNLGRLRTLGAIDYPQKSQVALTRNVMQS